MLEIIEVKDGEDGSANITIDVSDEFIAAYKLKTGKKGYKNYDEYVGA